MPVFDKFISMTGFLFNTSPSVIEYVCSNKQSALALFVLTKQGAEETILRSVSFYFTLFVVVPGGTLSSPPGVVRSVRKVV